MFVNDTVAKKDPEVVLYGMLDGMVCSGLFRHGIAPVSFVLVVSQTYADVTVLSFGFSGSLWYHDRHNEVFFVCDLLDARVCEMLAGFS